MNKYQKKLKKHVKQCQYILNKLSFPTSYCKARKRVKRMGFNMVDEWYNSLRKTYREDYTYQNRVVRQEYITYNGVEYYVSTVDLGINHGFYERELYYETMVFRGDDAYDIQYRYETREEALKGHEKTVQYILSGGELE